MFNPHGQQCEAATLSNHLVSVATSINGPSSIPELAMEYCTFLAPKYLGRFDTIPAAHPCDHVAGQTATGQLSARSSVDTSRETGSTAWQLWITPQRFRASSLAPHQSRDEVLVRMDPADSKPAPHLFWSQTVMEKWRNASDRQFWSDLAIQVGRDSSVAVAVADCDDAFQVTPADPSSAIVNDTLNQAARDVRFPIHAARTSIQQLDEQLVQVKDGDSLRLQLQKVDDFLHLADDWASRLLVEHKVSREGRCIRKRFYPDQWRAEIAPLLESIARDHDVHLTWDGWDRALPRLYADHRYLSRAVLNLVADAIEASPRGGTVQIAVAWQSNVSPRLSFSVVDQRQLLSKSTLTEINRVDDDQICSTFGRADLDTGIQVAKQLIELCGGYLSIQSERDTGSNLRFSLPVDTCQATLRTWLSSQHTKTENVMDRRVRVYAIGAQGIDGVTFDERLQHDAQSNDLIYRIGERRWLWFVMTAEGQSKTAERVAAVCQSARACDSASGRSFCDEVLCLPYIEAGNAATHQPSYARDYLLARRLTDGVQSLLSKQVPPIDQLGLGSKIPSGRSGSSARTQTKPLTNEQKKAIADSQNKPSPIRKPHFAPAIPTAQSGVAVSQEIPDQYPVSQAQASVFRAESSDVDNASHVTALQEIAGQWRGMRDQLESLSKRLRHISLNPMV